MIIWEWWCKMKIVGTSNFNEETFSEFFKEHKGSKKVLQQICNGLNHDLSTVFYKVVKDDYELYKWEP